jgi:hypothetical protein
MTTTSGQHIEARWALRQRIREYNRLHVLTRDEVLFHLR